MQRLCMGVCLLSLMRFILRVPLDPAGAGPRQSYPKPCRLSLMISSGFRVLHFTFRSMINFELFFIKDI